VVKCHSSFVNIWVCSKEVLAFKTGARLIGELVVQVTALVIVNSVKIGIRLFDKWVKPLDSVKVSESV
jgi:hypothetical protein